MLNSFGKSSDRFQLLCMGIDSRNRNDVFPTFPRQHHRIHIVLSGCGHLKTDDQKVNLTEGYGFAIFPGTTPNYYQDPEEPWEYIWIGMNGTEAEEMIRSAGVTRACPIFRVNIPAESCRLLMRDLYSAVLTPEIVGFSPYTCIQQLFQAVSPYRAEKRNKALYFDRCLSYIHQNFNRDISVRDIAEHGAIDRTYLYKLFKMNLDLSPQTYLINYRISQACKMLRSSDMSVSAIANAVGFQDFSGFSRQFRQRQQMSPTAYRQLGGEREPPLSAT